MKLLFFIAIFTANAFSAGWYAVGKAHEKCLDIKDGFLVCRENYVNDFCYGKERAWLNNKREKTWLDRGEEKTWFDRKLVSVRNLNHKCEYHGWAKYKLADGKWEWKCYINNREAQDSDCKGFRKR
ncbi:MAG: hypothetical protein LBC85_04020 [Fibromonadaceae bacterium]|nr:hypothetical protein [Fibromonadaceae bacterium]